MIIHLLFLLPFVQAVLSPPPTSPAAPISQNATTIKNTITPDPLHLPLLLTNDPWIRITEPLPNTPYQLTLLISTKPLDPTALFNVLTATTATLIHHLATLGDGPLLPSDYPFRSEHNRHIKAVLALGFQTPFTTAVVRPRPEMLTYVLVRKVVAMLAETLYGSRTSWMNETGFWIQERGRRVGGLVGGHLVGVRAER